MTPQQWAAFSNAFLPFDPVPPNKLDQWFVERPGGAFKSLARRLSPDRSPQRYILVGQPASGKSSELIKLAAELRTQHNALVVLFDMTDHIDVERANPVEVLFLMGAAIFKAAAQELPPNAQPAPALLQKLKVGLETLVHERTENKEYGIDLAKLLGGLAVITGTALGGPVGAAAAATASTIMGTIAEKFIPFRFTSGTDIQVVRRLEVEPQVEQLVDVLNEIIGDVESRTDRPLILLVDGLDKLRDADVISLNFLEKKFLNGPRCRVLYAGPLDLYYSPKLGAVRNSFQVLPFSHIKLHDRDNAQKMEKGGYDFMRAVVVERLKSLGFTPDTVITENVLDTLITGSGGVVRDLIRLVQSATLHADVAGEHHITPRAAYKALNELRRQLLAQMDPDYHAVLRTVRETHDRVGGEQAGERCDQLLRNGVVLSYINDLNDDIWYDGHTALTEHPWKESGL